MKRMPTANKLNIRLLLPLTEIVIAETISLREDFLHIKDTTSSKEKRAKDVSSQFTAEI